MKAFVYDLDHTLLHTEAKVIATNLITCRTFEINSIKELNCIAQNKYYNLNFDDYNSLEILNKAIKIQPYFNSFISKIPDKNVFIVTARENKQIIFDFFKNNNTEILIDYIYTVRDSNDSRFSGTTANRKVQAFEDIIRKGYTDIVFYDDKEENLIAVKSLMNKYDINIETILVKN